MPYDDPTIREILQVLEEDLNNILEAKKILETEKIRVQYCLIRSTEKNWPDLMARARKSLGKTEELIQEAERRFSWNRRAALAVKRGEEIPLEED